MSAALRVIVALALAFMCLSTAAISSLSPIANAAGDCSKITLKAYPMDEQGNWVTSGGKKAKITKNGGQLRIAVTAVWSNGVAISEANIDEWSDKGAFSEGFKYTWDGDALTVSPTGVITALKDGTTTIKVVPQSEDYADLSATISITTANQGEGLIVKKVEIVKESGKAYGDNNVRFTSTSDSAQKLYARVTYVDKQDDNREVVYSNYPGAPASETPIDGAFDTLSWQAADENYCSLTTHDGVATLKAIASATTQVFCSITGGDTTEDDGMGAGVVFCAVGVSISNGKTVDDGNPADSLKVKVVYEDDLSNVAKEVEYSVKEFEALGAVTRSYTLTTKNGGYATDRAYGVPIATLLMELGIDVDDIAYFTLAANDGANPGRISAKWLMKTTRYYFPNFDIGGSLAEREQVPTMLALSDSWSFNTMVTGDLNSGTRFRLVFGSATTNDSSTDKSIKFINTFTIVLNGSAASGHGDGDGSGGGNGGSGGTVGTGTGTGSGEESSSQSSASTGSSPKTDSLTALDEESSWRIYEMMNKSNSDVQVEYEDNPLEPYALPVAIGLLVLAMIGRFVVFRRRLR